MIPKKRAPAATVPDVEFETMALPPPARPKATSEATIERDEIPTAVRDSTDIDAMLREALGNYVPEDRSLSIATLKRPPTPQTLEDPSISVATLKRPTQEDPSLSIATVKRPDQSQEDRSLSIATVKRPPNDAAPPSSQKIVAPAPASSSQPRSDSLLGALMTAPPSEASPPNRDMPPISSFPKRGAQLAAEPAPRPRGNAASEVWVFETGDAQAGSQAAPPSERSAKKAELEEHFSKTKKLAYATPPTAIAPSAVLAAIRNATSPSSAQFRAGQLPPGHASGHVRGHAQAPPGGHSQQPMAFSATMPAIPPSAPQFSPGAVSAPQSVPPFASHPPSGMPLAPYPAQVAPSAFHGPTHATVTTRKKRRAVLPWLITAAALGACTWFVIDRPSREALVARANAWLDRAPAAATTAATTPAPAAAPVDTPAPPPAPELQLVSWQPSSTNEWTAPAPATATATPTATPTATTTATPTATTTATATATAGATTTATAHAHATPTTRATARATPTPTPTATATATATAVAATPTAAPKRTPTPRPRPVARPGKPEGDGEEDAAAAAANAVKTELQDTLDR